MSLVYNSIIQNILSFNSVTLFGHIRVKDKTRLNRVVNVLSKIVGKKQKSLQEIHTNFVKRKASKILIDDTEPLNSSFIVLKSGR